MGLGAGHIPCYSPDKYRGLIVSILAHTSVLQYAYQASIRIHTVDEPHNGGRHMMPHGRFSLGHVADPRVCMSIVYRLGVYIAAPSFWRPHTVPSCSAPYEA